MAWLIPPFPASEKQPRNKKWEEWFSYLIKLVPLLLLIGSLLTFTVKLSLDAYRWLAWKEGVDVITFSSLGPQVLLNSGDGEVFVSHVDIRGTESQVVYINKVIRPKEFLSIPVTEEVAKEYGGKDVVQTNSNEEWQDILDHKVRGFQDPSYIVAVFLSDGPELKLYKEKLKERLRTFPATATLVYYVSYKKQGISKRIPVEGIVLH